MKLASLALAALLTAATAVPALAARKETAAQVYKAGAVVKLQAVEIEIALPGEPGDEEWSLSLAVDGGDAWDVLRRQDGGFTVELSRARVEHCSVVAERLDTAKKKRIANPNIAPVTFEPWAFEIEPGTYRVCANTINGPVTADITASVSAEAVNAFLADIGRRVGAHRESAPLIAKGPPISVFGPTLLAASGIHVEVPKGFSLHTLTSADGRKVDLLERYAPRDPPLSLTVERVAGACPPLAGTRNAAPPYAPTDFATEAFETTNKTARVGAFCTTLGSDAIIVRVTFANDADARVVRGILQPAAAAKMGVGSSFTTTTDEADGQPSDDSLVRGVASVDLVTLARVTDSTQKLPFGAGLGLDAYGATASVRQRFGYGLEVAVSGGVGSEKLRYFDAHAGIGPALALGRGLIMPTVGGGIDLLTSTPFDERAAGYVYGGGRVVIPLARRVAVTLGGAYHHRFVAEQVDQRSELRGSLLVSVGAVAIGVRYVDYRGAAMATIVLGFTL